jgi:predicted nucleic acid-binding protein
VDLLIAATAKQHDLVIATLNAKDFEDIPGLRVDDWS